MTRLARLIRSALITSGPIRSLAVGGALLILGLALGTTLLALNFRDRALSNSLRQQTTTVRLLASHLDKDLRYLEVVQRDVIRHIRSIGIANESDYRSGLSGKVIHSILHARMDALPYAGGLNVFDADGNLINSSAVWPPPHVNIADRSDFQAFKLHRVSSMIEPVLSRLSGTWTTLFVRPVSGPNDEFLGLVAQTINPEHFERFFASVQLPPGAAILMYHRDGQLLARFPAAANAAEDGLDATASGLSRVIEQVQYSGFIRHPATGEDQLVSARALDNFPIVLVGTTSLSAALGDWREQTTVLIAIAATSCLTIAILLITVLRKLSQQHAAAQQSVTLEKQRLDRAINNMPQGLALFDANTQLVICNQRYIEMYGLPPDITRPGISFREIVAHSVASSQLPADVEKYVAHVVQDHNTRNSVIIHTGDGRSIQVINEPLADGGWLVTHEDITERRRIQDRITHLAHYDALTDLPNRSLFQEHLRQQLNGIAEGEQVAVHYIDIDEFKGVNDALGHLVGDEFLKSIAATLLRCTDDNDFVARLGGDEFAIVQSRVTSTTRVTDLVARVLDAIHEPFDCMGHQLTADASIGIALAPQHGTAPEQILKSADLAMYAAKSAGRRIYRFFEPQMDARVRERLRMEIDLRHAIAQNQFEVHYQPCLNITDNTITGCEALLRWRHPDRGRVSPAEFIPVAEDTGLINEIGEWVLRIACQEAASWPFDVLLAVNVSPVQFRNETLPLKIMAALSNSNLPASRLELEITEAVLIRDDETALNILHQLRAIGVRIALDDFGTGYSSLSYLQRFPFDKIKIDRRFVANIGSSDFSASIVQAVVNIAGARRMTTTAEGVETDEQLRLLRSLGCNEYQGHLFSPALPAAKIASLFTRHRARLVS
ncbi:MAG: EAL domain-containing protein [Alphaproteobacteria bacterium]|nr:EAL domain-containing protein [Alphaproteobacteria bacterium]